MSQSNLVESLVDARELGNTGPAEDILRTDSVNRKRPPGPSNRKTVRSATVPKSTPSMYNLMTQLRRV